MFLWSIIRGATIQKSSDRLGGGVRGQPELSSFFGGRSIVENVCGKKILKFPDGRGWGGGHLLLGQCHHKRRNNYLKTQLNDL